MEQPKFLPFALPDIGEDEITEVVDSLRSGWITTGVKCRRFETEFARFLNSNLHAIAVNSATAGLHLALEAVGIKAGDEVITTPYTFTATAEVIRYLGAHPVFVDIDSQTLNIDTNKIEAAITTKTTAILPVHFAGLACDMDEILRIAEKYKLKVVEDAAHAIPTRYKERLIGSLKSDATVYSFYATKTITTGEGGMIVTENQDYADRMKIMRLHGINRDVFNRYTSDKPSWFYEVIEPGYKYNMTDVAASIGLHQLKKAWKYQKRRNSIANQYHKAFLDLPLQMPPISPPNDIHSWHLYVIRLNLESITITRNKFIELMTDAGIGTSVHFIPLHIHPYWRDQYGYQPEDYPVAYDVYNRVVSLPIYPGMTDQDVKLVIKHVESILVKSCS